MVCQMNEVELFSGSGVMSAAFRRKGHRTFTLDLDCAADWQVDILTITKAELWNRLRSAGIETVDVVWASPPCTAFSVATISRNYRNGVPWSSKAYLGIALAMKTLEIIEWLNPTYWFIENPRGMMRQAPFMQGLHRKTVTYCQYGEAYQKPTDIWTNAAHWVPKPACSAGDSCHQAQPRGYRAKKAFCAIGKGVQGLSNAFERGKIPQALCDEVVAACDGSLTHRQEVLPIA